MRHYVIKSDYLKSDFTIIFKGDADIEEWKRELLRPIMLLADETSAYSVEYVVLRRFTTFKYTMVDTPRNLYKWFLKKMDYLHQSMIIINHKDKKKERLVFIIK